MEDTQLYLNCWYYNTKTKTSFLWTQEHWGKLLSKELSLDNIEPIRITKEILLSSNFRYDSKKFKDLEEVNDYDDDGPQFLGTGDTIYFYRYNWFYISSTMEKCWSCSSIQNMEQKNPFFDKPIFFDFIHEIQHFYFLISKKELVIKIENDLVT